MPDQQQKRPKRTAYETEKKLIVDTNFRKDVEEYQVPPFYRKLGKIQDKYEFIK